MEDLVKAVLNYARQLEIDSVYSTSHYTLRVYHEQFGKEVFNQAKAKYFSGKDAVRWQVGSRIMWPAPK